MILSAYQSVHMFAIQLADQLLDSQGHLVVSAIQDVLQELSKSRYVILSSDYNQEQTYEHAIFILQELNRDWEYEEELQRIYAPHQAPAMDHLLRQTLHLSPDHPLGNRETRQAALSALLCPLRQNIGSCFATAPAILVQSQYPLRLLRDLKELMATEALMRIIDGIEYRVPIAAHIQCGIEEHPLLKAWEFTLASFAEVQGDISRWNLYISLGCNTQDPGGIGEVVYHKAQELIACFQDEEASFASRYDHTFAQVKMLEGRLRRPADEQDARWAPMEYRIKLQELDDIVMEQQKFHEKVKLFTTTINEFQKHILNTFPSHFQEVYDAELEREEEDSMMMRPLGFACFISMVVITRVIGPWCIIVRNFEMYCGSIF